MTNHACGLEVTCCSSCQAELEVGQTGKCSDCEPPTFKFNELSEAAKQKARDVYTSRDYLYDEWWDNVYEDAVHMAGLIGIGITTTHHKGRSGQEIRSTDIYFSGFWDQGDGACFQGSYTFNPKAAEQLTARTKDEELIRIATGLMLLQLKRRLLGLEPFSATVTRGSGSNCYSHSGTMDVEIHFEEDDENPIDEIIDEVTQLMRDFADWIYKQLEAEHDYLTSDEVVDEQLAEETFDETGNEV